MFDWIKGRRARAGPDLRSATLPVQAGRERAEYQVLCDYLRDRHANRIVLTFSEIESLLGFSLPEDARAQSTWWDAVPAGSPSVHAAWTLAGRTPTANLMAQTVAFERHATKPESLQMER
jgi:hypothetical protein